MILSKVSLYISGLILLFFIQYNLVLKAQHTISNNYQSFLSKFKDQSLPLLLDNKDDFQKLVIHPESFERFNQKDTALFILLNRWRVIHLFPIKSKLLYKFILIWIFHYSKLYPLFYTTR